MPKFNNLAAIAAFALFLASAMTSALAHTPDEAKALAEKAAALVVAEGEAAFSKISDPKGEFMDEEMYVLVADHKAVMRVAFNPKLVGISMWEATDPDGVKFAQEIVKIAETTGSGWLTFKFSNPTNKKIQPKKMWVVKAGDFIVFSGVYVVQ